MKEYLKNYLVLKCFVAIKWPSLLRLNVGNFMPVWSSLVSKLDCSESTTNPWLNVCLMWKMINSRIPLPSMGPKAAQYFIAQKKQKETSTPDKNGGLIVNYYSSNWLKDHGSMNKVGTCQMRVPCLRYQRHPNYFFSLVQVGTISMSWLDGSCPDVMCNVRRV